MVTKITIGKHDIGTNNKVFIIAEAGVNHNGNLKMAKKLVDAAKKVGADAIKFQTFNAEDLVTKNAKKATYQKRKAPRESQYQMLKRLQLTKRDHQSLIEYCRKKNILFLSTPFDTKSAQLLKNLNVEAFKISSGDLTNLPFLRIVASYKKPIIVSTGMATLKEVREAVDTIYSMGNRKLILLHCTSSYPTKYEDVNLKAIKTLKVHFGCLVGYSDHTKGIEVSIAAVTLGACVIEKHLTLDHNLPGPDHQSSLEPGEFAQLIASIRHIEKSLGDGRKVAKKSELNIKDIARKSIVSITNIPRGVKIEPKMLAIKRPGTGIEPKRLKGLFGKQTKVKIPTGRVITWDMVK